MFSVHPKKLLRSSAFRLALVYVALFETSALLLLAFIYWSTTEYMLRQADETTEAEIAGMAERYQLTGLAGLTALVRERLGRQPSGSSIYLLADSQFNPLVGNLDRWPRVEPDSEGWLNFQLEAGESHPTHWARAKRFRLRGNFLLLVGRDMYELEVIRTQIARTVGWGLALTAALALAGGALVSRGRIRRIGTIHRALGEVIAGDLSRRIPVDPTGDDIEELAEKLNRMLDELEKLVEGVRRVSDSIAHDLRTPLTRLRNRLEALRRLERAEDQKRDFVERAIDEADGLLSTFNALLRIARIESGQHRSGLGPVDLSALVEDVSELYGPLIEEAGLDLTVNVAPHVVVTGDRDLLFQALANLLDNALKYTPQGGHIAVSLREADDVAELAVADDGPGIPLKERDEVFQRFYRLDASRSTPGAGLGLSLVAAVADLHDAKVRLEDNQPGLRAIMRLSKTSGMDRAVHGRNAPS
jgi:signal transduction histidine kinase